MSELKTNKVSPATSTALAIGDSGDTITVPSGATLDISASTLTPPATMPASSGINFTALNATNIGSGTVPTARLGSGTADATTFLRGDQSYVAVSSAALSHVSQWCLTAEVAGDAAPITASLAEVARDGYARVGSAMTESSGAFTFPATGIWRIDAQFCCQIISHGNFRYGRGAIYVTTNDTDWDQAANASGSHTDSTSYDEGAAQISITHIFDVTSTSTHKVRFHITQDSTSTYLLGNASYTHTNFIFSKLGDT